MMKAKKIILFIFILGQFVLIFLPTILLAGTENAGPEVKVFRLSSELRESLKDTRNKFVKFEMGTGPLEELASLNKEYISLKCQDSADQGCRELEKKIEVTYQFFLEGLATSVGIIAKSIRKSMKKMRDHFNAISSGTYPGDIAREMMNRNNGNARPAGPMSSRLSMVLKLIGTPSISSIELASNISRDLQMSLDQLSAIEMSVTGQLDSISLGVTFSDVRDWMLETTGSVRTVLGLNNNQDFNSPMDLTQTTESDYLN